MSEKLANLLFWSDSIPQENLALSSFSISLSLWLDNPSDVCDMKSTNKKKQFQEYDGNVIWVKNERSLQITARQTRLSSAYSDLVRECNKRRQLLLNAMTYHDFVKRADTLAEWLHAKAKVDALFL